jgi:hypothetical protein
MLKHIKIKHCCNPAVVQRQPLAACGVVCCRYTPPLADGHGCCWYCCCSAKNPDKKGTGGAPSAGPEPAYSVRSGMQIL